MLPYLAITRKRTSLNVEYVNVMTSSKGHYEVNGERARALNKHYGGFKKYFVRGAPCLLTGPYCVNVLEGLANWSFCRMHSLTFGDEQDYVKDELDSILNHTIGINYNMEKNMRCHPV